MIPLDQLTFEQLIEMIKPRIDFHVRKHAEKLPGFDGDDIRQELLYELWIKRDRIPKDITYPDYRFTRYVEVIFNRKVISLHRSMLLKRKQPGYRDGLNSATFVENFEEVFSEEPS